MKGCLLYFIILLLIFLVWHFIGCVILAFIDKDHKIKDWADKAPFALDMFVPMSWPLVLWFYYRKPKE